MAKRVIYTGVSFDTIRWALFNMYFYYEGMPQAEIDEAVKYIVPMQHNFDNPLQAIGANDTFIEYWIARDERMTQDSKRSTGGVGTNEAYKLADVDIRFVGVEAETWAKAFHHITKRENVHEIFYELCEGQILEFVGDIIPVNIDYYSIGNSSIAFDLHIKIEYKESVELSWKPLEYISLAPGEVVTGGIEGS